MKMNRFMLSAVVSWALVSMTGVTRGWDQSDVVTEVNALVDQEFPDYPDFSSYMMMDFENSSPWSIFGLYTFFTDQTLAWYGVTEARLNLFPKDGPLPAVGDDPTAGVVVPVSVAASDFGGVQVYAGGLDIDVYQGQHWIGLTPIAEFGVFGQEFHQAAAPLMLDDTAWRNPGGGFGYGHDWQTTAGLSDEWVGQYDAAFKIVIPEPASLMLLGLGGAMLAGGRFHLAR